MGMEYINKSCGKHFKSTKKKKSFTVTKSLEETHMERKDNKNDRFQKSKQTVRRWKGRAHNKGKITKFVLAVLVNVKQRLL